MEGSSCCPICYRGSAGSGGRGNWDLEKRFFKLLHRYLDGGGGGVNGVTELFAPPSALLDKLMGVGMMQSCVECFKVMEDFCELNHELRSVELRLSWKLATLKNIMKGAQRVPSRMNSFRECAGRLVKVDGWGLENSGEQVVKSVTRWKRGLISKCSRKIRNSAPKLCIEKWQSPPRFRGIPNEGTATVADSPPSPISTPQPVGNEQEDYDGDNNEDSQDNNEDLPGIPTSLSLNLKTSPICGGKNSAMDHVANCQEDYFISSNNPAEAVAVLILEPISELENDGMASALAPANTSLELKCIPLREKDLTDLEEQLPNLEIKQERLESPPKNLIEPKRKASLRTTHGCQKCSKTFSSPETLGLHEAEAHNDNGDDNDAKDNDCDGEININIVPDKQGPRKSSADDIDFEEARPQQDHDDDDADPASDLDAEHEHHNRVAKQLPVSVSSKPINFRLKCPDCGLLFQKAKELLLHRKDLETCGSSHEQSLKVEVLISSDQHKNPPKKDSDFTVVSAVVDLPLAIFVCVTCDLALYSSEDLQQHIKLHGEFHCKFCEFRDTFAPNIAKHELLHSKKLPPVPPKKKNGRAGNYVNQICCPHCDIRYFKSCSNQYVQHHLKTHSSSSLTFNEPSCPICKTNGMTLNDSMLGDHFKSHHNLSNTTIQELEKCKVDNCTAYFLTLQQLSYHMRLRHPQKLEEWDFRLKCPDCLVLFQDVGTLLLHRLRSEEHEPSCGGGAHDDLNPTKTIRVEVLVPPEEDAKNPEEEANFTSVLAIVNLPPEVFQCAICDLFLYSKEDIEAHQKLHGEFPCKFCSFEAIYAPDLSRHELKKHGKKTRRGGRNMKHDSDQVACPRCDFSCRRSYRKGRYVRHHLEEHLSLTLNEPSCPICKTNALNISKSQLHQHFKTHHGLTEVTPEEMETCGEANCNAYFLSSQQLADHLKLRHCNNTGNKSTSTTSPIVVPSGDPTLFPDVVEMEESSSKQSSKHSCKDCDKTFTTAGSLRQHRLRFHVPQSGGAVPCKFPKCPKQFETKREMERHLKNQAKFHQSLEDPDFPAPEKVYVQCPTCGKSVSGANPHYLLNHMRLHESSHVCEFCGKKFRRKDQLQVHYLSHSGPETWQFMCSVCSKKCPTTQKLEEHMRTHSKAKPFVCEVCGQTYAHRHNLRLHVNAKHGDQAEDVPGRRKTFNKASMTSKKKGVKRKRGEDEDIGEDDSSSDSQS